MEDNQEVQQETVALAEDVSISSKPKLLQLFEEYKNNPAGKTDHQILNEIMDVASKDVIECYEAALPQTVEMQFNLVNIAFSTVLKILMHRHGIELVRNETPTIQPAGPTGKIIL